MASAVTVHRVRGCDAVGLVNDDQVRCRRDRFRHSVDSTVSDMSRCSLMVSSEPRSTTKQREVGSCSSSTSDLPQATSTPDRPIENTSIRRTQPELTNFGIVR